MGFFAICLWTTQSFMQVGMLLHVVEGLILNFISFEPRTKLHNMLNLDVGKGPF